MNKILALCPLHSQTLSQYQDKLVHLPHLESTSVDLEEWRRVLETYRHTTIIFGGGVMSREMLSIWRELLPQQQLRGLRRGTTLATCDLEAAKKFGIQIFNTPGVNAPFVAQFIYDSLRNPHQIKTCAILGAGNIGGRVAKLMAQHDCEIRIFRKKPVQLSEIKEKKIFYSPDIFSACTGADAVIVALPLSDLTRGLLHHELVHKLPKGSQWVSVSLPDVFTEETFRTLHGRKDIHVVIDELESLFPQMMKILGVNKLRKHFNLVEKAARSEACQKAMDDAVLMLI